MRHRTTSPQETFALAEAFAQKLAAGDVVALDGELGAGKTLFVQGLASGLGIPGDVFVRSPSFAILNDYRGGRVPLYHLDFYRLTRPEELRDLGLEEYLDGDGICVVEWAERFPGALPARTRRVRFEIEDETTRTIEFGDTGKAKSSS
jgi:tRNA threonylcarbamoyladenosine biosynthesis protein TsaE